MCRWPSAPHQTGKRRSRELATVAPVKESGLGREGSHLGIEEFVEPKYMLMGGLSQ